MNGKVIVLGLAVAYLGFHKGGQIFAGHYSAYTKGAKPARLFNFFLEQKKIFGQRGHGSLHGSP